MPDEPDPSQDEDTAPTDPTDYQKASHYQSGGPGLLISDGAGGWVLYSRSVTVNWIPTEDPNYP